MCLVGESRGKGAQLPVGMCSTWSAINYTHNRLADGLAGGGVVHQLADNFKSAFKANLVGPISVERERESGREGE